ncbi:hypothetical protein GQ53DRAFT_749209 [Thozetella sp. PMI_491]|nr:hypothetical protein GQ53DRAFT_749209 [Thozetella sp. PMI_491]
MDPANKVWYFAYGSNMSSTKFAGDRGIVALSTVAARVPRWRLGFLVPGLPYAEPAFGAIEPIPDDGTELASAAPTVQGVLYLITRSQYVQVLASEGGGTAYRAIHVLAEPLSEDNRRRFGARIQAFSLQAHLLRKPAGLASLRYMNLILEGAQEAGLTSKYQAYLQRRPVYLAPETGRSAVGATVFLRLFGPVMGALERLTKSQIQSDGLAPLWVVLVVRYTVLALWAIHDIIFAPIFGRGDGLGAL